MIHLIEFIWALIVIYANIVFVVSIPGMTMI